jgi:hypothetical protein
MDRRRLLLTLGLGGGAALLLGCGPKKKSAAGGETDPKASAPAGMKQPPTSTK